MAEAPAESMPGDSTASGSSHDETDGVRNGRWAAPRWRFTDAVQAARHVGGSRA